jgi:hypothetical protein
MDRKTAAAVAKYTEAGCIRAFTLNAVDGEGARSIALLHNIPNVETTRAADAAIEAGRILTHVAAANANEAARKSYTPTITRINKALKHTGHKLVRNRIGYYYVVVIDINSDVKWVECSIYCNVLEPTQEDFCYAASEINDAFVRAGHAAPITI